MKNKYDKYETKKPTEIHGPNLEQAQKECLFGGWLYMLVRAVWFYCI